VFDEFAMAVSFTMGGAVAFAWCYLRGDWLPSRGAAAQAPADGLTSSASLQTLIDAIPAIVNCKDREGRYVLMNAYQAALYGTTPGAARGQTAADLLGPRHGAHAGGLDGEVIVTGQPAGPVQVRYPDPQGRERSWLTSKSPIKDAEGRVTHVVTAAFDITEYKRIEALLIQARNEAEAASRAKASFLATMSHELRTPLNAIIGFSELMRRAIYGPLGSAKYEEYVGDVWESGRFLLSIINDVLDLSKVEAGQMVFCGEAIDLGELLDSCCHMVAPRAQQDNIAIDVEAGETLPCVHADRRLLIQIITNLLTNAVKFSRAHGRVLLAASARNQWIELRIIDQGAGMTEEEVAIALRPFEQVDRDHARKHEGTGLGLPIAKALIDLHRGELEIDSRPGAGTTVTIRLPPYQSESGQVGKEIR
jgi:PAS domain S-box-containing protein